MPLKIAIQGNTVKLTTHCRLYRLHLLCIHSPGTPTLPVTYKILYKVILINIIVGYLEPGSRHNLSLWSKVK